VSKIGERPPLGEKTTIVGPGTALQTSRAGHNTGQKAGRAGIKPSGGGFWWDNYHCQIRRKLLLSIIRKNFQVKNFR